MLKINPKLFEEVIFENSTGLNDSINFTKSIRKYSKIKIFSKITFSGYTAYFTTECEAVVGGSVSIEQPRLHSSGLWLNDTAIYLMNEKSLTKTYEADVRITESNTVQFNKNTTRTLITKVIGII